MCESRPQTDWGWRRLGQSECGRCDSFMWHIQEQTHHVGKSAYRYTQVMSPFGFPSLPASDTEIGARLSSPLLYGLRFASDFQGNNRDVQHRGA